jgi:cell division protein FtsX
MSVGPKRLFLASLLGLAAGLGGETLLFLAGQCGRIETSLRDDFKVVFFLRADLDEGKRKIIEEQFRAFPEVEDVRGISKQEALTDLKRTDPELVDSIILVGENPLQNAYEVRLGEAGVARLQDWLGRAQELADWADIRYKPSEVEAILRVQFYGRFLSLALSAIACLIGAMALGGLWSTGRRGGRGSFKLRAELAHCGLHAALGAAGAAVGATVVFMMVLPMRQLSSWWAWPSSASQLGLAVGAAVIGWALCADGD